MRVAFYAPMKPPSHPSPSGDRRMGRLLMQALTAAGHDVELASIYRSYDRGDAERQKRVQGIGQRLADRLVRSYLARPVGERPQIWFTYHLYHKAPDWIGPVVSKALNIPYVIAEASHAPKQSGGRWHLGYTETAKTIAAADLVISFNEADNACLLPVMQSPDRLVSVTPFIDTAPFVQASHARETSRQNLARETGLDSQVPWLVVSAMMRRDQKLKSYRLLAQALEMLGDVPWRLIVVGDGVARDDVDQAFSHLLDRIAWLGVRPPEDLPDIFAAADIYVWPAIKEAYGMAFLEAQAAGLPVVASDSGGVAGIVENGQCGVLVSEGDAVAFAGAVCLLLIDDDRRRAMGQAARERAVTCHGVDGAIASLNSAINDMMKRF